MDNVTHALAGLLLAASTTALVEHRTRRPTAPTFRRAAALIGVITAELPDADLVYAGPILGMGKLGYLLHHRGHTHTVLFAIAGALLVWAIALATSRTLRDPQSRNPLLALSLAGALSHLALDYTNSYGVHPFWPLSNAWHYGDAVFIVEPWLWIAAIPPLLWIARSVATRVLLAIALAAILALAWRVDLVGRDVAIALTVAAIVWLALTRFARPTHRVALALTAWLLVEATLFTASAAARTAVRQATGRTYEDVALTPAIGDPLCFDALVMERDGPLYRVTSAAVAPFPRIRSAASCDAPRAGPTEGARNSPREPTPAVRWIAEWSAPRAELATLARESCEAAAALRFIRVPVWRRLPGNVTRLSDLRFNRGGGGFASVDAAERSASCPPHIPPWVPPRQALLAR